MTGEHMPKSRFKGLSKAEREQFWFNIYQQYQSYPGTLSEFLKEQNIAASAFYRWSKLFKDQATTISEPQRANNDKPYALISPIDAAIQQAVDVVDEPQDEYDSLDKKIAEIGSQDNPIMAAMEIVLPDGYKVRLANHADVSLAIRLVQGIAHHD